MAELHVSDQGTFLRWSISDGVAAVDVSAATTKQVKFKKPDASTVTKTLVFSTKAGDTGDGTDGRVEYVVEAGFLDQSGSWEWQIFLVFSNWQGHSDTGTFSVSTNLF